MPAHAFSLVMLFGSESIFSDYDRSLDGCKPCRQLEVRPMYMRVPCSGLKSYDETKYVSCPNLINGMCLEGEYFSGECTCSKCRIQPSNCSAGKYYVGCNGRDSVDNANCGDQPFECGADCAPGIAYEQASTLAAIFLCAALFRAAG